MSDLSRKDKLHLLVLAAAGNLTKDDLLNQGTNQVWMNLDGTGFRFQDQFKTVEEMKEATQKGNWHTVTFTIA